MKAKMYKYSYGAGQWRGVANSSLPRRESRVKFIARQPLLTSPALSRRTQSRSRQSRSERLTHLRARLLHVWTFWRYVFLTFSSLLLIVSSDSIELLRRELRKVWEGEREKKLIVGQLEIANGALRFVFCVKVDRHRTETFNYQTSKDLRTRSDELNEPSHLAFKIRREDESFSFSLLDSVSQREQFRV